MEKDVIDRRNKIVKKVIKIIEGAIATTALVAVGYIAYLDVNSTDKLTPEQQKIVYSLEQKSPEKVYVIKEKINLGRFNTCLENAKREIKKGNIKTALDEIINANGLINDMRFFDKRELQAKLLEVRKELAELE